MKDSISIAISLALITISFMLGLGLGINYGASNREKEIMFKLAYIDKQCLNDALVKYNRHINELNDVKQMCNEVK